MDRVAYEDLLGVPFRLGGDDVATGLDCWGMAREVCRRAGLGFPDVTRTTPEATDLSAAIAKLVPIARAEQVGDLLLSDPEDLGYPSHAAALVAPGWSITTSRRHGPRVLPVHRVDASEGVYRVA